MTRRFDDLQPDEMPEALNAAVREQDRREREQEREMDRAAYEEAALELGMTRADLDRGAAELHAAKVAEIRRRRTLRNRLLAAGISVLALFGAYRVVNPPAPDPTTYTFESTVQAWSGEVNARTSASVRAEGGRGIIEVRQFVPEPNSPTSSRFWVNLNTPSVPPSLRGYGEVSFRIRGDGTLRAARLFFENGPTERWRSPEIPIGPGWTTVRFRLDQFEHQTRTTSAEGWRGRGRGAPGEVAGISIKVGDPFNPPDARGRVEVDDLRIE